MMRLIDADALNLEYEVDMADDWKTAHEMANIVKYAPTVYAVPVVRCWACKYYHTEMCPMLREQDGDGYCSFGKPRMY